MPKQGVNGARLREARWRRAWSQQQLADLAGVSLSTVERAERGAMIRLDSVRLLCAALEQTPEGLGLLVPLPAPTLQQGGAAGSGSPWHIGSRKLLPTVVTASLRLWVAVAE